MATRKKRLDVEVYVAGVLAGDKVLLSRAITLIESNLKEDIALAEEVLEKILPHAGKARRIGITGVPGVGKSTFIEALGMELVEAGKKLAVLAVDPSSQRSGGSILGDKTRMERLAHHPNAYIRPSATGDSLGGVANKTRESMLLCEAAGYEVIFVETVGVGQSEVTVKGMVDFFLLLMLAGAGDELQGIKKGIMEMADAIAITKAEGENLAVAKKAKAAYKSALHLFLPSASGWVPQVTTCSAVTGEGISEVWQIIQTYFNHIEEKNTLQHLRALQNIDWMHEMISWTLKQRFYDHEGVSEQLMHIENQVGAGKITPQAAARQLLLKS